MCFHLRFAASLPFLVLLGCVADEPGNPLIAAARNGDVQTIRKLLAAGADPDLPGGVNGWTPLMHAVHKHQEGSVTALLDGGADVKARNPGGTTALMMAAGYGYARIVRDLLAHGADPRVKNHRGDTALAEAVGGTSDIDRFTIGQCRTDTVKALLEAAPDLRLENNFSGRSARLFTALGRCSEELKLLHR